MSMNDGHTGSKDASEAARIMSDPDATAEERSVAASDLRQDEKGDAHTSAAVASEAGHVEADGATADERSVAASDLFQADAADDA